MSFSALGDRKAHSERMKALIAQHDAATEAAEYRHQFRGFNSEPIRCTYCDVRWLSEKGDQPCPGR